MRTDDIVARIRALCPGFAQVDHALLSASQESYPGAFVALVKADALPSSYIGAHVQIVRETIGVFITLERRLDEDTGEGSNDILDDLRAELRAALVNWTPPGANQPLDYAGGELALRNGIAAWRDDFATQTVYSSP